jgi:EmrB/QacA subfamily drug resistance transporter
VGIAARASYDKPGGAEDDHAEKLHRGGRTAMTAATAAMPELTRDQKIFTMVGTLLALLLAALDQTIVSTAGPAIQRDLDIAPSLYVWITTSYLVASTVLVPIYGKLSDLFGRRSILLTGVAIFLLGSLLCGLAQDTTQLILFRAVQGVGSAALFTTAFAVVADIFPPAERGKYQGLFGAVFGLSSLIGPLIGGFITDHLGWHWVFFVNLPIGALVILFITTKMPPLRQGRPKTAIDIAGAATLAIAVVPLLLALSLGKSESDTFRSGYPWGSFWILGLFGVAAAGIVAFVLIERRAADPILDFGLFRGRPFALGALAAFIAGSGFLGTIVFLPQFMVYVVGLSATLSGLTIMPLTLGIVVGNIVIGHIVSYIQRYKVILVGSLILLVLAFTVMGFTLSPESTQLGVTLKMILVGMGLGPAIPLYTLAMQNAVPPSRIGVATATATFARQMGATIGIALIGTIFAGTLSDAMAARMGAVAESAPPALRAQLPSRTGAAPAEALAGEGAPASAVFDAAEIKAELSARFDALRVELRAAGPEALQGVKAAPGVPPEVAQAETPEAALAALDAVEPKALALIDETGYAFKQAFTEAISRIFQVSILIALLALLVTLWMPELPLRSGEAPTPAVE